MNYQEAQGDLFNVPSQYYLAHCISSDFAMGAGIAKQFASMGVKEWLKFTCSSVKWNGQGYCLYTSACDKKDRYAGVFNLVTKEKYFLKPTYIALQQSLENLRDVYLPVLSKNNETINIAMPEIGCGLDKLEWSRVSSIIKDVFCKSNVNILIVHPNSFLKNGLTNSK